MGFVKWKSNPCDSYFEYACWGFRKEAVDLNYADYRPYNEVMDIEYSILIELLFQTGSDQWPTKIWELHRLAKGAHRICRATEGLHADLVGELYSAKSRGIGFVLSKFEQLHPIWAFYTPVVADDKCYLFPPDMFVPEVLYKSSDFKDEFSFAYVDHLKQAGVDDTPEVRKDIDFFFGVEQIIAALADHPKRRLFVPFERPVLVEDFSRFVSADVSGCKGKPYVWSDKRYYEGLKTLVDGLKDNELTLYMILWSIQVFSIAGKENTPLASLHYRYVGLLNNPPSAERRCIDYMEPMLRQFYLDHLRMSHVYQRSDLPRLSQAKANVSMNRLVESVKIFLGHSALADTDVAKASAMASAGGGQGLQAFRGAMGSFVIHAAELNKGWPIPAFTHEPMYIYGINTIFVPYPVFAWAYMHSKSKLPFSIPVYGLKIIRELFKAIDYRAQWWVGKDSASEVAYQKLEDCVKDIERIYKITEPVERYETIAEIAAVHVIFKMYTEEVDISKKTAVDVRLPFFQTVHSTTQFFIALASEMCARTNVTIASLLNKALGAKTAEQRMEMLATHMPQYTEHFGCTGSQRMRVSNRYMQCLFWNR